MQKADRERELGRVKARDVLREAPEAREVEEELAAGAVVEHEVELILRLCKRGGGVCASALCRI